jgi:hypothetical protein
MEFNRSVAIGLVIAWIIMIASYIVELCDCRQDHKLNGPVPIIGRVKLQKSQKVVRFDLPELP